MSARTIETRSVAIRTRAGARLASVPVWVWLVGLVAVSAGIRFALAVPNPGPWIFQDEIVHWELATSLGNTGGFAIRDVPGRHGFGVVYPALLSPATAIFDSPVAAYTAAKAINALLMSLAAVPTYFLARRLVGPAPSLIAAALAIAIPGMVYTASMMSENAFYPLVVTFALALVLVLEKPTPLRQLAVFVVIALAFATRSHAAILVAVLLTSIAIIVIVDAAANRFTWRAVARSLGRFAATWAILAATAIVVVALQAARGTAPNELLGAAAGVTSFGFPAGTIARWFLYHLADLDLSVGFLPFGAFLIVVALALSSRRRERPLTAFAAASLSLVFWFTLTASVYAAQPIGQRIEERYLFHVVPVLLVALVVWATWGLPRPVWAAGPAIAVMAALPAAIPYDAFLNGTTAHSTFSLVPLWSFRDKLSMAPGDIDIAVLLGAIAAGLLLALLPPRWAVALPVLVVAYFAFATSPLEGITTKASRDALRGGIALRTGGPEATVDRSWIDRAVGRDAEVSWLWPVGLQVPLWETEFFNRSVGRVYNLYGSIDGLPQKTVSVGDTGELRSANGNPITAEYVLVPGGLTLAGQVVGNDTVIGTKLFRIDGPLVIQEQIDGLYTDNWSGPQVTYTRFGCTGGTLTVRLSSFADLHPQPQTVTATSGDSEVARITLPVGAVEEPFDVPLSSDADGRCTVLLSVAPTAVPAMVLGSADPRELGALFVGFEYRPADAD